MPFAKPDVNFWIASALFMGCSKTGQVRESHDLLLVHCGFPDTPFNRAFPKAPGADFEKIRTRSEAFFGERSLSYELTLRTDEEAEWTGRLEAGGFARSDELLPVMTLDLRGIDPNPALPDGLVIEPVKTPADITDYAATAFAGFDLPAAAGPMFMTEQLHARPEVTCLLGRLDGLPVSTSMVVQTGDVSGIYWVATLPEARGRGIGEALTWAAVRAGARLGGTLAVLQASKMGRPVYARMGFDQPYAYAGWSPPSEPVAT